MVGFFTTILGITMILLPFVLFALDIVFIVKKKEKAWIEVVAFLLGIAFLFNAYLLWDLPDYDSPLNVYGTANAHEPVIIYYIGSLLLFF